eukprot:2138419-Amphidinium_carterae.2
MFVRDSCPETCAWRWCSTRERPICDWHHVPHNPCQRSLCADGSPLKHRPVLLWTCGQPWSKRSMTRSCNSCTSRSMCARRKCTVWLRPVSMIAQCFGRQSLSPGAGYD